MVLSDITHNLSVKDSQYCIWNEKLVKFYVCTGAVMVKNMLFNLRQRVRFTNLLDMDVHFSTVTCDSSFKLFSVMTTYCFPLIIQPFLVPVCVNYTVIWALGNAFLGF